MPRPSLNTFPRPKPAPASHSHNRHVSLDRLPVANPAHAQLQRILNSRAFAGAHRSQLFLRYIVGHALNHPDEPLKEYNIALDVFDRDAYDPAVDATVRVEAGRLRSRLLEYYAGEGQSDPLLIEIPKGGYRAVFHSRQPGAVPVSRPHLVPAKPIPSAIPRLRYLWAIPVAFLLGALFGHRSSH